MGKEFSKDYARETIDKAVDVFVDLILEESKSKVTSKSATNLLTLMLQATLCTSNTFENDFFAKLGKVDSGAQSLFLSNEIMLPIVRALSLIKEPSEREEIAKKLVGQIFDRINKIWLENSLTFHELIRLLESYADIANVVDNSKNKNLIIRLCDSNSNFKSNSNDNANTSKFRILYWAFANGIPDILVRYSLCDALDKHYSKES